MKHFYILICLCGFQLTFSQNRDPRADQFNYESQEIIVKLKDNVSSGVTYNKSGEGKTTKDIGELLEIADKVKASKVLFNERSIQASIKRKQTQTSRKATRSQEEKTKNGYEEEDIISLNNIFLLELSDENENIDELISALKENPAVEFAEPNYRYSVNDFKINSEVISASDLKKQNSSLIANSLVTPNDPLFPEQTHFSEVNIDELWNSGTTGDGNQIIAILDTGIDYNHPDLKDNIWINEAELNGVAGYDDDGNGFIDDIQGWNFVNTDNSPLDDNLHGTHVAGIAGAVTNNEIGIAGAAWNVKLMPIKAFQSNGMANSVNIAQGIEYAANNGATIINMSFGSSAESYTVKATLKHANETAILVAAAGNDSRCIGPGKCPDKSSSSPSYPGAYDFVLGIEDDASYSNYDQDGPIFSKHPDLLNYELKAPGTGILSTVPGGGYRKLTGTSMSSPLVAGGIALYLHHNPDDKKGVIFGNLINTSKTYVDFLAALNTEPTSELKIISAMTKDTLTGQNGNDFIEPGEIIDIFPLVKNFWGFSNDVRVGIEFAEEADTSKAEIVKNIIAIGSISEYATLQDLTESLQIRIAENVKNDEIIRFNLNVWAAASPQKVTSTEFNLNIKNAVVLSGLISENLTLYPDKEYLVAGNLVIGQLATLTILPGVKLYFSDNTGLRVDGLITANGTKDSIIYFLPENNYWNGIQLANDAVFEYCHFSGSKGLNNPYINNGSNFTSLEIRNCIFTENEGPIVGYLYDKTKIHQSVYYNNNINYWAPSSGNSDDILLNTNFINNKEVPSISNFSSGLNQTIFYNNDGISLIAPYRGNVTVDVPIYLGSYSENILKEYIFDFFDDSNYGIVYLNALSSKPFAENHGIVWKVLVNGKDAQDEYELMDPVGVGLHEFKVYFNRPMDTSLDPQISYGVREPYTQKVIPEKGTWSADGKTYTVNHEVKIGAADGINRLRVQGARDLDYFDIPVEDFRFNMLVQSAGSASSGFFATADLGKINLIWEKPAADLMEDLLGYNMYRHEAITDSTFTEPEKLNEKLIGDVSFSDFEVEEGKKYFYQYKILRTNFEESDFSKTVSSSPLTSLLGDSNGDFDVNVLDLVQDVDYILGNNPQPFIFKAADVNGDQAINVLDIVGTVDIINSPSTATMSISANNPSIAYYSNEAVGEVSFYWEENDLFMESELPVGAFQLAFEEGFSYEINEELSSFEWSNYKQENSRILMMYSFSGAALNTGKTRILSRKSTDSGLDIEKAVVGTPKGERLTAKFIDQNLIEIEAPLQPDHMQMQLWPNPTRGEFNMNYYLPEQVDAIQASMFNLQGKKVWSDNSSKNTPGRGEKSYDFGNLNPGIYILIIDAVRAGEIKHRETKKIIIK